MPRAKDTSTKGGDSAAQEPAATRAETPLPKGKGTGTKQRPKAESSKKGSAYYMRRMRDSLTGAGYVKHEAYVLPENKDLLKQVEKRLRQPIQAGTFMENEVMSASEQWTIDRLYQALQALDEVQSGELVVSLMQGAEPSIKVEVTEFGGLPVFIAVVGEQIIVDTLLVDQDTITDPVKFNDAILRSRELFPLSSIGIETMPNEQTVYNMFGALSSASSLTNVVTEIHTLVENVQRATEAFTGFFKTAE